MADLSGQVVSALQGMGFELQRTSFEAVTAEGEMSYLRSLPTLPPNESSAILKHFPHYFVVHRSATPESGIFFVTVLASSRGLGADADKVYRTYFPKKILLVAADSAGGLVAKWHHSADAPRKLEQVLQRALQAG